MAIGKELKSGGVTTRGEMSKLAKLGQLTIGQSAIEPHLKQQLSLYDSIPNFYMSEFSPQSSYTRSIGIEVL